MFVDVFPPRRGMLDHLGSRFALQQDYWNDYSFQTLYHLYYQSPKSPEATLVGPVKILRRGQTASHGLLITKPFDQLSSDYCSVGASLDYYQRLGEVPLEDRVGILEALCDVVANGALRKQFEHEDGWRISLFRDNSDVEGYLADAAAIYSNNFGSLADLSGELKFQPTGWASPLVMNFDAPEPAFYLGPKRAVGPSRVPVLLPRRILVVIGRNGSGKSTLLSRIARVAFAAPSDRLLEAISSIGAFDPPSVGFARIIAISYSAFDNFVVPAVYDSDLQQIASDVEKGGGRYVYAGLRDIAREARDELSTAQKSEDTVGLRSTLSREDRRPSNRLKSLDQLADEFVRFVEQIEANGDTPLLDAALGSLLTDQSFVDIEGGTRADLFGEDVRNSFINWSTGHKIVLHVLASLVAHATRRSLVLFDEPESHLHPPLTASLMNAIRIVLEEKNALAIVATHSPVVVQETLACHVRIVTRVGNDFDIQSPMAETFGENVGILTQGVFGLNSSATDFHKVLDLLVKGLDSIEEINALFSPSLSGQALAYVMAGLARKEKEP